MMRSDVGRTDTEGEAGTPPQWRASNYTPHPNIRFARTYARYLYCGFQPNCKLHSDSGLVTPHYRIYWKLQKTRSSRMAITPSTSISRITPFVVKSVPVWQMLGQLRGPKDRRVSTKIFPLNCIWQRVQSEGWRG